MNEYVAKKIEEVHLKLESIGLEEETSLHKAKKAIFMLKEIMQQLKIRLSDHKLSNKHGQERKQN